MPRILVQPPQLFRRHRSSGRYRVRPPSLTRLVGSLAEFRKRDDTWLMSVDQKWPWGPTNNYCKWFHVCEHESNHNGQIKFLAKRLPGAKPDKE